MNVLYQNVARACREKGLTISALCESAGISPGILSDLKSGRKKSVSSATLSKLAQALGVSSDSLLGVAEPEPQADPLIACYGEVSRYLDDDDRHDLMLFMRMRAEMKKNHDKS